MAGQFINTPSPSRREARNFENELDIVIVGNKSDKNVTSGQYVTVRDSAISGITNGIYKATANVAAGTAFVAANLSAVTSGALNDLSGDLALQQVTVTPSTNVSNTVYTRVSKNAYFAFGTIVCTTSNKNAADSLFSGLPIPKSGSAPFIGTNDGGGLLNLYINNNGALCTRNAITTVQAVYASFAYEIA